jgi:hypothetical protein
MAQDCVRWLPGFVINSVETPEFVIANYNVSSSNKKHNKRTYSREAEPF